MKTPDRVAVLALPALLLSQGIANASAKDSEALAACTDAIANFFEVQQGAEPATQIDAGAFGKDRRLGKLTVFELDAFDANTQNVVGRFSCTVNRYAKVRQLRTLPLTAPNAAERGRS